jgi:ferric-dicitrate binding protein FerR (iron transport regulator)
MATTRRERTAQTASWVRAYEEHRRRYEAWCQQEERLRALVPKALEVLERALDDPEQGPRLALAVLKAAGLWGLEPVDEPSARSYQLSAALADALGGDEECAP